MRRTMAAVGGPNYTDALKDADARTLEEYMYSVLEEYNGRRRPGDIICIMYITGIVHIIVF